MSALILLCLMMLLTSCSSKREVYVPVQPTPIPAHLISDCELISIPNELTYGEAILLLAQAQSNMAKCNIDKSDIRRIEAGRLGIKNGDS
ncbi:Rz1-like lysis system protein LysC [Moellerella wisconsensis]|uniref:Rz1-like lysis system protein LysC n=1 Tax=Moellerella wisconsensis TaxID=158849 RepID=UPI003B21DBC6